MPPPSPSGSVLFVTPAYGRSAGGGLGVSAERIARHLAEDFPVRVITPSPHLPPYTYEYRETHGVCLMQLGHTGHPKTFLQFLADVLETESCGSADPLFFGFYCNELAYAVTLAAARRNTAPVLFARGNDVDLDIFGEFAFYIHHAVGRARRVFCVSREMEAKVRAFCPGAKARYVPNGVDTHRFAFQDGYTPSPRPVVGLFGDVKQKKGLELLLAALDFGRFDLCIVGQLREENRKLLHGFLTLHPEYWPHVALHPYTEDEDTLREHYRRVDIVCIPSLHEGMSNVLLEAMACGKLCVCSAVGGALDVVRDGGNGFLFEPRSAESLTDALTRAARCLQGDHTELRRQARTTVENQFSAKREGKRYRRAVQAMLS